MQPWRVADRPHERAASLAHASISAGDPTGWFEQLYGEAAGNAARIPWADLVPNPWLVQFLKRAMPVGPVLVVGCGLGDDAEALAGRGYTVTAFDVSPAGIAWCHQRFPTSTVTYEVADLLALPDGYAGAFGFVVEIFTVQSLPLNVRESALVGLANTVARDGTLLLIARGREDAETPSGPPWAVSRGELATLETHGLGLQRFEDFFDDEQPPKRRFVATFRRP